MVCQGGIVEYRESNTLAVLGTCETRALGMVRCARGRSVSSVDKVARCTPAGSLGDLNPKLSVCSQTISEKITTEEMPLRTECGTRHCSSLSDFGRIIIAPTRLRYVLVP